MTHEEAVQHAKARIAVAEARDWPIITFYRAALLTLGVPGVGPEIPGLLVLRRRIEPVKAALAAV